LPTSTVYKRRNLDKFLNVRIAADLENMTWSPNVSAHTLFRVGALNLIRMQINPLTAELNPSAQHCLTRFLLGILLLESCISLIYAWKTKKHQLFIQLINYVW
jgi:hypothetical protein